MPIKSFKNGYLERLKILEGAVHDVESADRGLSEAQISRLINAITSYGAKGRTRSGFNLASDVTAMDLPSPASIRLISCLVPGSRISGESVRDLALWALTNWRKMNIKCALEPVLRWVNCILHYDLCPLKDLQVIYEGFLPLLNHSIIVSDIQCTVD